MPLQKVVQLIVPYNIVCILVVHARRVKTERVVERGTLCAGTIREFNIGKTIPLFDEITLL